MVGFLKKAEKPFLKLASQNFRFASFPRVYRKKKLEDILSTVPYRYICADFAVFGCRMPLQVKLISHK